MKSPVLYTLLCLLLCFLSGAALQAQTPPKFRHLTTADGLPSNGINAIFEDKAGFLWIGTDAGLARYDGRNVEAFRYNSNSENSIAGNGVFQITQDGRGNIWAMTAKHLNRYNPVLRQWKRYPLPYKEPVITVNYPLFSDSEGNVWWVKGNTKIDKSSVMIEYQSYRIKTESIQTYALRFSLNQKQGNRHFFHNLFEYKGELYAAGGFIKYDKTHDRFVQVHQGEGLPAGGRLSVMTHDEQGTVYYFAGDRGDSTIRYDLHTQKMTLNTLHKNLKNARISSLKDSLYLLPLSTPFCALYDRETYTIWVGSYAGLEEINLRAQKHIRHTNNSFDNATLRNDRIVALYKDSKGNIWVGTENGLSYFPSRPLFYHEYPRSVPSKATLSNRDILSITEDAEGNIWMGTKNKISVWNRAANDYTTVALPIPQDKQVGNMIETRSIVHQNNRAYAATWGAGLYEINPESKQAAYLSLLTRNADPKDAAYVKVLYDEHSLPFLSHVKADEQGNIWSIDWGRGLDLACYNPRNQRFKRYDIYKDAIYFPNPKDTVKGGLLMSLAISPDKIFVGSQDLGVYQFDRQLGHFNRVFRHNAKNPNSLSSNNIKTVFVSGAGELWVGTENGLNRLKKDGTFERFQNFSNNYIAAVEEDDKGFLWVATKDGLCRLDPRTGELTYYTHHHGLQSGGFNDNAIFKSSDGEIFVGGANGFNYFHPDSVVARQNKIAPHVALTRLKVLNQSYALQDTALEFRKAIKLASDENDLQFTFAALDLTAPENNRYQYRLMLKDNGWFNIGNYPDTAWISMGDNNTLNLSRVRFGEYLLEVRASAAPGPWSQGNKVMRLYLTISPPWYLNKYYVLIGLLAIIGFTVQSVRIYQRSLKRRNQELEAIVAERTRELKRTNENLAEQAEALRMKNEEIKAQAEELKSQNELIEKQKRELERLQAEQTHNVSNNYDAAVRYLREEITRQTDPKAIDSFKRLEKILSVRSGLSRELYGRQQKNATYVYNLPTYVDTIIRKFENLAESGGLDVEWKASVEDFKLSSRELRHLERIIVELYHNAEKYLKVLSEKKPQIRLILQQTDAGWKFTYRDNGSGYPEHVLQQGASALVDLYRTCEDLGATPHIFNDNGACFELMVNKD